MMRRASADEASIDRRRGLGFRSLGHGRRTRRADDRGHQKQRPADGRQQPGRSTRRRGAAGRWAAGNGDRVWHLGRHHRPDGPHLQAMPRVRAARCGSIVDKTRPIGPGSWTNPLPCQERRPIVLMSPEGPSRRNRRGWSASHLGSAAAVQPGSSVSRTRPADRPSPGWDPGRRDRQAGTSRRRVSARAGA